MEIEWQQRKFWRPENAWQHLLKINFKLGGENYVLREETTDWYGANAGTMVVGADVAHSGQSSDSTIPSLADVVATNDSKNGHYLGRRGFSLTTQSSSKTFKG